MKLTTILATAAAFSGAANAWTVTFYSGENCRGQRLHSQQVSLASCARFDSAATNHKSVCISNTDDYFWGAEFSSSDNCGNPNGRREKGRCHNISGMRSAAGLL